jgi:hypothetical protein
VQDTVTPTLDWVYTRIVAGNGFSAACEEKGNMRAIHVLIGLVAALLVSTSTPAHSEWTFTGRVIKLTEEAIIVRTEEGRNVTVPVGPNTNILDGQNKVGVKAIKVGQNVEVSTFSDFPDDLSNADIRILSPEA